MGLENIRISSLGDSRRGCPVVLHADSDKDFCEMVGATLAEEGFRTIACFDGTKALAILHRDCVDAIITELRMPEVTGMELINHARRLAPDAVILVATAYGQVETAVEAMKKGVSDYLCKPLVLDDLVFRLKRAMEREDLGKEVLALRQRIQRAAEALPLMGESPGADARNGFDAVSPDLRTALRACEKHLIAFVLARVDGDRPDAAQLLGIGMSSLYRKIEEYGLARESAAQVPRS